MTIRKITVPLIGQSDGTNELVAIASLRTGFSLGRLLGAYVEVCCFAAEAPDPAASPLSDLTGAAVAPLFEEIEKQNTETLWHARTLFDRVAEAFLPARPTAPGPDQQFSAEFVEVSGDIAALIGRRGRLSDLIVVAVGANGDDGSYRRMLHALLTETGRPLLIVPAAQESLSLGRIAIAWNDTSEATRAVAMTLDLLQQADSVALLTVLEDGTKTEDAAAFADYLLWHGIEVDIVEAPQESRQIGSSLQEEATRTGADLMIMGAFTRSRLQRLLFGGASGTLLRDPALPLLMVD